MSIILEAFMLKTLFPFSCIAESVRGLVISLVGYLLVGAVISLFFSWLAGLWIVGWIFKLLFSIIDAYCFVGMVVAVLIFLRIIK